MNVFGIAWLILCSSIAVNAQESSFKIGKAYNEVADSSAVPLQLVTTLRKLVPNAKDISWGHLFCTECPKDGTYSYYQAEFYQGDDQNSITFNENAQLVAFKLKTDVFKTPKAVQDAIARVARKIEADFKRTNLEILSFNVRDKVFYEVIFYIPTEDKKHWTQYEKLVFTESGSVTKSISSD